MYDETIMIYVTSAWYEITIKDRYITEYRRIIGTTSGAGYTSTCDRRIVEAVCYIPFIYKGCLTEVVNVNGK